MMQTECQSAARNNIVHRDEAIISIHVFPATIIRLFDGSGNSHSGRLFVGFARISANVVSANVRLTIAYEKQGLDTKSACSTPWATRSTPKTRRS